MPVFFLAVFAAVLSEPNVAKWVLEAYAILVFGRVMGLWR